MNNSSQNTARKDMVNKDAADDDLFSITPRHPDSRLEVGWLFLYHKLPPDQWFGADYAYKTSG